MNEQGDEPVETKRKYMMYILGALILCGGGLRVISCFWGYPYQLHPDEPTIVCNAVDMIARHSWVVNVYNRPDHFEIKCNALIFQVVSLLKYKVSAEMAFGEHTHAFYLLARFYTAFWGTLMIPLIYLISEKIKKGAGLLSACMTAFYPLFIKHSAYATPDIVLTFMILLMVYISMLYLEKPTNLKMVMMCVVSGIGITIKYTSAICCLWIAFIVIYKCVSCNKGYFMIVKYGLICILAVMLTVFFIAPNLFTNFPIVLNTLRLEARSQHLGADGLGVLGNLRYYWNTFRLYAGIEISPFVAGGVYYTIRLFRKESFAPYLGIVFWFCTSLLPLHWERWGIPIYAFFLIFSALGMKFMGEVLAQFARKRMTSGKHKLIFRICYVFIAISIIIILGNEIISGIVYARYITLKDTRIAALDYCGEKQIDINNSIYEGYTPLLLNSPLTITVSLDGEGKIVFSEEQKDANYIILSSKMYDRYYAEPQKYAEQVAVYDAIAEQCGLVFEILEKPNRQGDWACINVLNKILYGIHLKKNDVQGPTIKIYTVLNTA